MAHLVNPTNFRVGKTFPWLNSAAVNSSNSQSSLSFVNTGLENSADYILQRSNSLIVKSAYSTSKSGLPRLKVIYYPIFKPNARKRHFPTYLVMRKTIKFLSSAKLNKLASIQKLWTLFQYDFQNRFIRSKLKLRLNSWVSKKILRGSGLHLRKRFIKSKFTHSKFLSWINSVTKLSSKSFSLALSKRVGLRTRVKLINVFSYLGSKRFILKEGHQDFIWGEYQYNKKIFQSYYDVINAFYILSYVYGSEKLLVSIIQQSLLKMHKRKLKPKRFFYFLDKVIKTIPDIKHSFLALRVIITGKLRGGTARTGSFSAGFGELPRQSLSKNVLIHFGDIRSKYGSFGVKVLTWRN